MGDLRIELQQHRCVQDLSSRLSNPLPRFPNFPDVGLTFTEVVDDDGSAEGDVVTWSVAMVGWCVAPGVGVGGDRLRTASHVVPGVVDSALSKEKRIRKGKRFTQEK